MKTCSVCKQEKSESDFYFEKNKGKLRADCRECHRARMRPRSKAHYQANKDYYRRRNKRTAQRTAEFIREIKNNTPCADCCRQYPYYVMQFDHLEGYDKKYCVGRMWTWTISSVQKEIEKCELVCANCHAERSYQRLIKLHPSWEFGTPKPK